MKAKKVVCEKLDKITYSPRFMQREPESEWLIYSLIHRTIESSGKCINE
jgi:hypothetical protein